MTTVKVATWSINDNSVYINGDQVATSTEFAQSAAELATVPAPASEEEAEHVEWLPLGTFAVSAGESDVDPNRIVPASGQQGRHHQRHALQHRDRQVANVSKAKSTSRLSESRFVLAKAKTW